MNWHYITIVITFDSVT